jgi:hypothetical protein
MVYTGKIGISFLKEKEKKLNTGGEGGILEVV